MEEQTSIARGLANRYSYSSAVFGMEIINICSMNSTHSIIPISRKLNAISFQSLREKL